MLSLGAIQEKLGAFPSCACDLSGQVGHEEAQVVLRLMLGQKLTLNRHYLEAEDNYGVSWYWAVEPVRDDLRGKLSVKAWNRCCEAWMARWYPRQWDGPVMRLIGREVIKPETCGGGYTQMVFTTRGREVFNIQLGKDALC